MSPRRRIRDRPDRLVISCVPCNGWLSFRSARTYEVVDRAHYRTLDIPDQLWHSLRVYFVPLGTELRGYHALAS